MRCFFRVVQVQSEAPSADDRLHSVSISPLLCFRPVVKITDTLSLFPPSLLQPSLAPCNEIGSCP